MKVTKAKRKLEARRQQFEAIRADGMQGTSKLVRRADGRLAAYHRPGSLKK